MFVGVFRTLEDLTNQVFGRLTVIERAEDYVQPNGSRRPRWKCQCECGNIKITTASNLKRGITTSCGCFQRENMSRLKKTHGGWANNEKLFGVWIGIRKRCLSSYAHNYSDYGGRGITICDEWKDDYSAFKEWSISNGYKEGMGLSIDRIDVDGDYCPENCRWADNLTQQNNKRNTIYISANNEKHSLKEWSRIREINYQTLYQRYKLGWNAERMLDFID